MMAGEVTIGRRPAIDEWDQRTRELVLSALTPKYRRPTFAELAVIAEHAERTGLSPLPTFGQLYGIYRKDTAKGTRKVRELDFSADGFLGAEVESNEYLTVQVGIDGLRTIAQRTGEYESQDAILYADENGMWVDVWTDAGNPVAAKASVWRKGSRRPTQAVVLQREYSGGQLAGKMPVLMLGKVAEAHALRKAFPADLSGLYIAEEFERDRVVDADAGGGGVAVENAIDVLPVSEARRERIRAVVAAAETAHPGSWGVDRVTMMFGGQPDERVDRSLDALEAELGIQAVPDADVVQEGDSSVAPGDTGEVDSIDRAEEIERLRHQQADLEARLDEGVEDGGEADALRSEIAFIDERITELERG